MPTTLSSTQTNRDEKRKGRRHPELIRVFRADAPRLRPERLSLSRVDVVTLGRGEVTSVERSGGASLSRIEVLIDDPWMSGEHARVVGAGGNFILEDCGSRNGTFVNGARAERVTLEDGDLVELGHTFFLFRWSPASEAVAEASAHPSLNTSSAQLREEFDDLRRIATSGVTVLIRGESGTGKELTARAVHDLSGRTGAFVAVNCGALPRDLVEAELFGHRRGAFSGATEDRPGLVRAAHQGTLFLDEIGDLPTPSQAALLRVLQEREVRPVGATTSVPVDIRVISATHRDLEEMIDAGSFRRDLYARLSGYECWLPPLRERREDIGALITLLLEKLAGPRTVSFAVDAARALLRHDWPLNIRELEQTLTTALALCRDGVIELERFPKALTLDASRPSSPSTQRAASNDPHAATPRQLSAEDEALRRRLEAVLLEHGGNVSAAAREMGKDRRQIHRWVQRFELDLDRFRSS